MAVQRGAFVVVGWKRFAPSEALCKVPKLSAVARGCRLLKVGTDQTRLFLGRVWRNSPFLFRPDPPLIVPSPPPIKLPMELFQGIITMNTAVGQTITTFNMEARYEQMLYCPRPNLQVRDNYQVPKQAPHLIHPPRESYTSNRSIPSSSSRPVHDLPACSILLLKIPLPHLIPVLPHQHHHHHHHLGQKRQRKYLPSLVDGDVLQQPPPRHDPVPPR